MNMFKSDKSPKRDETEFQQAQTRDESVSEMHTPTNQSSEDAQRKAYGGFNFGAGFFGWLVANSVSILLIGLLSAIGSAVALTKLDNAGNGLGRAASQANTIGLISAIGLLLALVVAYYAGGYVAGRMSRFDGGRQGFGVWLIGVIATILLAAAGAILGAKYNLLGNLNIPSIPVDGSKFTIGGALTALAALVATALAALAGGKVGERYHHKVDNAGLVSHGSNSQQGISSEHFAHR